MSLFNQIINFLKRIVPGKYKVLKLWEVDKTESAKIKKQTGYEVDRYTHSIDSYSIKHIQDRHPDLEKNDIAKIPDIIHQPDQMYDAGNKHIGYKKEFKDKVFTYIEEILSKKKRLNSKTLYKNKKKNDG
ncbi:MAG TPA: hypothetical protein PLX69_17010 [Leptospiraceae bacterium]|nr:hypothetical protein [Leptospiraceae bacterium]HRG76263.1 hypothetical protein [Leptospiraceae bacterium]